MTRQPLHLAKVLASLHKTTESMINIHFGVVATVYGELRWEVKFFGTLYFILHFLNCR